LTEIKYLNALPRKKLLFLFLLISGGVLLLLLLSKTAKADETFVCQCGYSSGDITAVDIDTARASCQSQCASLGGYIGITPKGGGSLNCNFCCCTDGAFDSGPGVDCSSTCSGHGSIQISSQYDCNNAPALTCQASAVDACQQCKDPCYGTADEAACLDDCSNGTACGGGSGGGSGGGNTTSGGNTTNNGGFVRISNIKIPNFLVCDSIGLCLTNIANFIIKYIVTPLAILMLILAGFRFATAQGNEEKLKKAKSNFLWTAVGLAVIAASSMIIAYIQDIFSNTSSGALVSFIDRVKGTLNLVIGVLFSLVTVYFIWGVIQYVRSGGNEEKLTEGKRHMVWGIIGMAIMAGAWGIATMIANYVTTGK